MGRNWNTPIITKRKEVMRTERGLHMYGNPRAANAESEMRTECQVTKGFLGMENPEDQKEERGKR